MIAAIVIALVGCQSVKVTSEYGPGMSYDGLGSTYAWGPPPAPSRTEPWVDNPSLNAAIRQRVDDGLRDRGFRLAEESADFTVTYRISTVYERGAYTGDVKGTEGRLAIELTDPASERLFWRGTARTRIDESDPIDVRQKRLTDAVRKILDQLPQKAPAS
jgi:hypothetical protein